MLQSLASLAETTAGAFVIFFAVAAMAYAIIKLSTRRLRRPYFFLAAVFLSVAFCRITYFVLIGPFVIAYLLMCKPLSKQTSP